MTHVLVCGGAGYIGAHMAKGLAYAGCKVTVFDNLSTGHRAAMLWGEFVEGDLLDRIALGELFATHRFDAVMHFCALSQVSESARDPYAYYRNNVTGTLNLLEAMRHAGVDRLVFSSTAAVYGVPMADHVDESHPTLPINPYGASKLMVERMLEDAAGAYGLRSAALRYFNAAGADPDGEIGESHAPETHLIPNVLRNALGLGDGLLIFGDDYSTRDGTCVRDYVHVTDLVAAHLLAMSYLNNHGGAHRFNLGSGSGYTVMEVIEAARKVTGKPISFSLAPRRAGDPQVLVADSKRAAEVLGWRPSYEGMPAIIESAWRWHCNPRY
ncbi:UDP-glucose 4-epimerase GalE [Rhodanobacter terrae]|uniref:UDP-glucose 4-epimerase n=1 Tax=Rhodanobacter terrae TaxID=418647 RepID=A0ABW0SS32_9GAMM